MPDLSQGKWYWRVMALDAGGNGENIPRPSLYSLVSEFTVDLRIMPNTATSATIIFDWNPAFNNPLYAVIVNSDTDNDPTTQVVTGYAGCPEYMAQTQCSLVGLPLGTYSWYLKVDYEAISLPAQIFRISPPAPPAPTLLTLANNVEIGPNMAEYVQQTFTWNAVPVPVGSSLTHSYEIQFNPSATFNLPSITSPFLTLPQYTISLPEGVWYWRVRTLNNFGVAGAWSLVRKLTFDEVPPAAPTITSPLENSTINTLFPTIRWNTVSGAVRYRATVGTSNVYEGTATSFVMGDVLKLGLNAVTITAYDRAGNAASSTRLFRVTLGRAPLNDASISLPGTISTTRPTFQWFSTLGASTYRFEISDTTDFNTPRLSKSLASLSYSLTAAEALPLGDYYWRVYPEGMQYGGDDAFRLIVRGTPPAPLATSLTITPDALISATDLPTGAFAWTGVTLPANVATITYEVQFARNSAFTLNLSTLTTATTNVALPQTLADGIIYARVRTIFDEGLPTEARGTWATRTYTQDAVAPVAPRLTAPLVQISTSNVRIAWGAVTGAVAYEVIVDGGTAVTRTPYAPS
jgi:hypothetical protein